jgi:hypothetical protein
MHLVMFRAIRTFAASCRDAEASRARACGDLGHLGYVKSLVLGQSSLATMAREREVQRRTGRWIWTALVVGPNHKALT